MRVDDSETHPMTEHIPNDESANTLVKYLLEKGLGAFRRCRAPPTWPTAT